MPKLIYTPKALDDLQGIKTYISEQFGGNRADELVENNSSPALFFTI